MRRQAFTLIELLVVIAIVSMLAAILFPVFAQAKAAAKKAGCSSNFRQVGTAFLMYMADSDDRLPDRRDLKSSLPGGYRPWTSWPPSDPRAGWAAVVMDPYIRSHGIWECGGTRSSSLGEVAQVAQSTGTDAGSETALYWLWRFDRFDDPVLLDNLWGKSESQAVEDLRAANHPQAGMPEGAADVELAVDPYFPRTIPTVPNELKGKAVHFGGRNRLFLDFHVKFLKDPRT